MEIVIVVFALVIAFELGAIIGYFSGRKDGAREASRWSSEISIANHPDEAVTSEAEDDYSAEAAELIFRLAGELPPALEAMRILDAEENGLRVGPLPNRIH